MEFGLLLVLFIDEIFLINMFAKDRHCLLQLIYKDKQFATQLQHPFPTFVLLK